MKSESGSISAINAPQTAAWRGGSVNHGASAERRSVASSKAKYRIGIGIVCAAASWQTSVRASGSMCSGEIAPCARHAAA